MTAQITAVNRRLFGIARTVYAVRCPTCRWRAELRDLGTAHALAQQHVCPDTERSAA